MIIELALSFVTGLLVKFADDVADKKLSFRFGVYAGIAYGLCIAYIASQSGLSSLWLGVVVAMILVGKINNNIHAAGVVSVALPLLVIPIREFNFAYFIVFAIAAALDEMKHDPGMMNQLGGRRLVTPIVALGVSLYSWNWLFFASIALFDIAYNLMGMASHRLLPHNNA